RADRGGTGRAAGGRHGLGALGDPAGDARSRGRGPGGHMSTAITRRQALSDLVLGTALILAGCGGTGAARQDPSGSTLHATWQDPAATGQLVVGPAEPFVHRTELGGPARTLGVLATLAHLTDAHVLDAESP